MGHSVVEIPRAVRCRVKGLAGSVAKSGWLVKGLRDRQRGVEA